MTMFLSTSLCCAFSCCYWPWLCCFCSAMRPGEVEGKDYFFVSKEKFESWIESGQLLEHALVYGEYKGIPRQQVDVALQQGSDVVLRIDVQVSQQLSAMFGSRHAAFAMFTCTVLSEMRKTN